MEALTRSPAIGVLRSFGKCRRLGTRKRLVLAQGGGGHVLIPICGPMRVSWPPIVDQALHVSWVGMVEVHCILIERSKGRHDGKRSGYACAVWLTTKRISKKVLHVHLSLHKVSAPFRHRKRRAGIVRPITVLPQATGSDGRAREGDRPVNQNLS